MDCLTGDSESDAGAERGSHQPRIEDAVEAPREIPLQHHEKGEQQQAEHDDGEQFGAEAGACGVVPGFVRVVVGGDQSL
ncbi:hypothetical protein OIE61_36390 [Streptomyces sp. NBC_01762]|uniref:hypothetical protein n=1 Tax=Streptomyces sp. NBC_01762 TaxID=2975933 RepID=UPI002DDB4C96|nr:hypothetical protein [Streptomyces sp. NBC_01762]WSC48983.1 hypothetical protein OIE61_36390 [Streptomyces sp. NBC_01762]